MAQQYMSHMKCCATCTYWLGERKIIDAFGAHLSVPSSMQKGKCTSRNSGWRNQDKQAGFGLTCRGWEKWGALK